VQDAESALIESVCERVRERVAPEEVAEAEAFVRAYYRRAPAADLAGREPVDLYGAALAHWTFGRDRPGGELRVRVYNPTFEQHGWQSPHTAIEIVSDDMPFLVDSVSMELSRRELGIHVLVHPVVGDESYMHIEIDRQAEGFDELAQALRGVLEGVRVVVDDWRPMRERMDVLVAALASTPPVGVEPAEADEARAFLAWLADHHFTFLGYREYALEEDTLRGVDGTGLGLLRGEGRGHVSTAYAKLPPAVRALAREPHVLVLTKANARSPVHRPSYLDYVGVKRFDDDGNVVGEYRFLGLYTTAAYREVSANIPVLRRKAQAVRDRAGFPPGSHDDKALVEVIDTFPRDELIQMEVDELDRIARGILELGERQRVRLFMRADRYERFVSCLVFLPRDRFNTANRIRVAEILREALGAETVDWGLRLTEWVLVRIHYTLRVPGDLPSFDVDALEERIREATRGWEDDLQEALLEEFGEEHGTALFRRYGAAFPPAYRDDLLARSAIADVQRMETLEGDEALDISLYRPLESPAGTLRCKLYRRGERVSLSDVLPMFESLGLTVTDERPYKVAPRDGAPVWIYDFGLQAKGPVDADAIRERFHEGFARVWHGDAEQDGFNGLIVGAGLDWREVTMVRAVARYLRQIGIPFSDRYMEETLLAHAGVAAKLSALFHARFDPSGDRSRAEDLGREIEEAIDAVDSLDQDRILRGFLSVLRAMLRTNYFIDPTHPGRMCRSSSIRPGSRSARGRGRSSRSSSIRRGSRACTCAAGRSRAAACAGRTGARTSAPRSSA
jgi:glutamate dehydrogenase